MSRRAAGAAGPADGARRDRGAGPRTPSAASPCARERTRITSDERALAGAREALDRLRAAGSELYADVFGELEAIVRGPDPGGIGDYVFGEDDSGIVVLAGLRIRVDAGDGFAGFEWTPAGDVRAHGRGDWIELPRHAALAAECARAYGFGIPR